MPSLWVKSSIRGHGLWHGAGEVFAHLWAYGLRGTVLGPHGIIDGADELVQQLSSFASDGRRISVLRIKGHGGQSRGTGANAPAYGSFIFIGETSTIDSDDFDVDGNLAGTRHAGETKQVLDALKAALCPGAKLVFTACDQSAGGLLKNVSSYLGNSISVAGHSRLGVPWGDGDLRYTDGEPR